MSFVADPKADAVVIRLTGPLTIGSVQQVRQRVLAAMGEARPITLDCGEGTAFDVAFLQLLESARLLAIRQGTELRLAQPLPPRLAEILAEGGFRGWTAQDRSAV